MTIQVQYWSTNYPDFRRRYPYDKNAVSATEEQLLFYDDFISSADSFSLLVYENGLHNPKLFADDVFSFDVDNSDVSDGSGSGRMFCLI